MQAAAATVACAAMADDFERALLITFSGGTVDPELKVRPQAAGSVRVLTFAAMHMDDAQLCRTMPPSSAIRHKLHDANRMYRRR